MRNASRLLVLSLLLLPLGPAQAEEGMWTFDQLPREQIRKTLGVDLDDAWVEKVQAGTLRLGNGCSASLVSDQGLVLTNHHCARGCIANLSSAEENLLADGFLANSQGEERVCPGLEAHRLESIQDVTAKVEKATRGKSGEAFQRALEQVTAKLESACSTSDAVLCQVISLHRGARYHLYRFQRLTELRLVFAPEHAIANFGGDPDNFEFPRWDLDMTLLRVWDGEAPLATPEHLPLQPAGAEAGDPVFVVGNPGSTERLLTEAELRYERDVALPRFLEYASELRGRLAQFQRQGPEAHRIADSLRQGVENGIKGRRGGREALIDPAFFAELEAGQARLREAVERDRKLRKAYGGAWAAIEQGLARRRALETEYLFLEGQRGPMAFSSSLFGYARALVRGAEERGRPATERLPEYTPASLPRLTQWLFAPIPVYPTLEEARLVFSLEKLVEALGPDHPTVKTVLGGRSPENLARELVQGTHLADPAARKALWEGGAEAVAASEDPMIVLARQVDPRARAIRKAYEEAWVAVKEAEGRRLAQARFAVAGDDAYPDATFSPRVSYGRVQGWTEPDGTEVPAFTDLQGAFGRHTGEDPFALPEAWLTAKDELTLSLPFNLSTTNDVVGGNSGSPLLDAQGRVVGLIFDGNIHSLAGDYGYDLRLNRTVAVDVRVMLHVLDRIYGADRLLSELGVDGGGEAASRK